MARAPHVNSTGRRPRDRGASARGPLVLSAALAALILTGRAHAQTPDQTPGNLPAGAAPPSQDFANGKPSAAQKAMQDAIPLTPEMIEELGRRFNATQRAREEAVTPLAAPLNRQINVSFAPGAATSIISTVKGYPTAVSFFDSTGQPWPIQSDTNRNPAAVAGGTNCNAPNNTAGGPSVAAIGF
jgi:intracellular multiplication protein IcmK